MDKGDGILTFTLIIIVQESGTSWLEVASKLKMVVREESMPDSESESFFILFAIIIF